MVSDEGEEERKFLSQSTSFFNGNGNELVSLGLGSLQPMGFLFFLSLAGGIAINGRSASYIGGGAS